MFEYSPPTWKMSSKYIPSMPFRVTALAPTQWETRQVVTSLMRAKEERVEEVIHRQSRGDHLATFSRVINL